MILDVFIFKDTEIQPLMGLTSVCQMADSPDPPVIPLPESLSDDEDFFGHMPENVARQKRAATHATF